VVHCTRPFTRADSERTSNNDPCLKSDVTFFLKNHPVCLPALYLLNLAIRLKSVSASIIISIAQ